MHLRADDFVYDSGSGQSKHELIYNPNKSSINSIADRKALGDFVICVSPQFERSKQYLLKSERVGIIKRCTEKFLYGRILNLKTTQILINQQMRLNLKINCIFIKYLLFTYQLTHPDNSLSTLNPFLHSRTSDFWLNNAD